jgi:DNA-binding transcriptional regulator YhcF (GntR family)
MEKMELFLKDNFLSIWHHFLSFEIERSKTAVKVWGSANGYLVFQVICWHYILVLTYSTNLKLREEALRLWLKISKAELKTSSVLTYSLIAKLTSLSIETVRRQVKKLEENNWVSYSKKNGVILNSSDKNIEYLTKTFNKKELENLGRFMDVVCKELKTQKLI